MQDAVSFFHALADPARWRIALLVAGQTQGVCALEDGLRLPQSTLSSHLSVMRAGGLLEVERRGRWAYYKLSAALAPAFVALREQCATSLEQDPVRAADRERTAQRVALRGSEDCGAQRRRDIPLPLALARRAVRALISLPKARPRSHETN